MPSETFHQLQRESSDLDVAPSAVGERPAGVQSHRSGPALPTPSGQVVAACLVGAVAALSGFWPLNNIPAVLHVAALPGFTLLTPAVLVALLAAWMSRSPSIESRLPTAAIASLALIVFGATLSLTASRDSAESVTLLILAILAPTALFIAVQRGCLPVGLLAGSFITALTAVLVHADLVFLEQNGLPTPTKLFDAKFANRPYDFHYYTLGNPDHTATFLILPLTVCVVWSLSRRMAPRSVWLLRIAAAVMYFTLILTYGRFPLLVCTIVVLGATLASRLRFVVRGVIVIVAACLALAFAIVSPGHYLSHVFSTTSASSGQVRVNSLSAGLTALRHEPLTGVGLGQFGLAASPPAHSSVVQAGAEIGIVGAVGLLVMTATLGIAVLARARRRAAPDLRNSALLGAALYGGATAFAGPGEGLFVGLVSVYGLSLALFAGIAASATAPGRFPPLREAVLTLWIRTRATIRRRLAVKRRRAWILYGIAWSPATALIASAGLPAAAQLSSSRLQALNQVIAAHHLGLGPLVGIAAHGNPFPIALTDDQGAYLVTPWISDLLNTASVSTILRTAFIVAVCVLVALYPLVILRLTKSRFAAVTAPLLLLLFFSFLTDDGFYWVPAASLAGCLPWLLVFVRERRAPVGPLVFIAAVAGATNLFRAETGLGLVIACLAVGLIASVRARRRAATLALVLLAYIGFGTGTLDLAFQARGARMHSYPVNVGGRAGVTRWSDASGHPFWHTAYIGLGIVHNRYGISYDDRVAAAYVRGVDPAAPYVGPEYESILRQRVLYLVRHDPGFVLRAEKRKLGELLADSLRRFWLLLVLVPMIIAIGVGRGRRLRYLAICLPPAIVACLPSLVAVPTRDYEMPWLGLLATVGVISSSFVLRWAGLSVSAAYYELAGLESAEPILATLTRIRRRWAVFTRALQRLYSVGSQPLITLRARIAALAADVTSMARSLAAVTSQAKPQTRLATLYRSRTIRTVLIILIGGIVARGYLDSWKSGLNAARNVPVASHPLSFDAPLPSPLASWRLADVPSGWIREHGATIEPGASLSLVTSTQDNAYQLESPVRFLHPGSYVAAIRGTIGGGGLSLGVLDKDTDTWIQITSYRRTTTPKTYVTDFAVPRAAHVQIVLSNFSTDGRSRWALSQALLASQSAPLLGVLLPIAAKLPPPALSWRFGGLPKGWGTDSGTVLTRGVRLGVRTSAPNNRYQLQSPVVPLPPGDYVLAVRGKIQSGGIGVGLLDRRTNRWLSVVSFDGGDDGRPGTMINGFTTFTGDPVQIILYNFSPVNRSSRWSLAQVLVAPEGSTALSTSLMKFGAAGR